MILVFESVWIAPSRSRTKPRTVYMVGRPARSMWTGGRSPPWNSGPRELVDERAEMAVDLGVHEQCETPDQEPRDNQKQRRGSSRSARSAGTTTKSNGSRSSGVRSSPAKSQ